MTCKVAKCTDKCSMRQLNSCMRTEQIPTWWTLDYRMADRITQKISCWVPKALGQTKFVGNPMAGGRCCDSVRGHNGTLQAGTKQGSRIYDGTAVGAAQLYADGVHSHSFSRVSPWFSLQLADTKINEIKEVKEWLQEIAARLYTSLAMSNFYDSSWMFIYDGGTIGVATMYNEVDKSSGKQVFETIHPG